MIRTQLEKGIWVVAMLATLGFPGAAWAVNCSLPLTFTGLDYTQCFTDVRRGTDINDDGAPDLGGTGHTALNFTGGAGPAGDLWLTKWTPLGTTQIFGGGEPVCMQADVLIHAPRAQSGARHRSR